MDNSPHVHPIPCSLQTRMVVALEQLNAMNCTLTMDCDPLNREVTRLKTLFPVADRDERAAGTRRASPQTHGATHAGRLGTRRGGTGCR